MSTKNNFSSEMERKLNLPINQIICGDCLEVMKTFSDESIDLIATDPPYGLEFMGKDWDKAVPKVEMWKECLRVLKSGAFMFVMSAPRQDVLSQMIVRLAQAGFETGFTSIYWAYASGFPKAMNISKAVDKRGGANLTEFSRLIKQRRMMLGLSLNDIASHFPSKTGGLTGCVWNWEDGKNAPTLEEYNKLRVILKLDDFPEIKEAEREVIGIKKDDQPSKTNVYGGFPRQENENGRRDTPITISATSQAKALDGSYGGFQPKPAVEIIIVCMKPLSEKTYVDQALVNGKGVTWLEDTRIPFQNKGDIDKATPFAPDKINISFFGGNGERGCALPNLLGRFPANLLVSDDVLNDGKITDSRQGGEHSGHKETRENVGEFGFDRVEINRPRDVGSFSRYFDLDKWFLKTVENLPEAVKRTFPFLICPKASKTERDKGLECLPEVVRSGLPLRDGSGDYIVNVGGDGTKSTRRTKARNIHPTVKPLKLMSYLVTLGSRPKDVILDPFIGSGTTALACKLLNRNYVGIEIDSEYVEIARKRLATIPEKLENF